MIDKYENKIIEKRVAGLFFLEFGYAGFSFKNIWRQSRAQCKPLIAFNLQVRRVWLVLLLAAAFRLWLAGPFIGCWLPVVGFADVSLVGFDWLISEQNKRKQHLNSVVLRDFCSIAMYSWILEFSWVHLSLKPSGVYKHSGSFFICKNIKPYKFVIWNFNKHALSLGMGDFFLYFLFFICIVCSTCCFLILIALTE